MLIYAYHLKTAQPISFWFSPRDEYLILKKKKKKKEDEKQIYAFKQETRKTKCWVQVDALKEAQSYLFNFFFKLL